MKELNRKTFFTIFILLSLFVIIGLTAINVTNYQMKYSDLNRTLFVRDDNGFFKDRPNPIEFNNLMIMNYEVYTVQIDSTSILTVINHGNESSDFDIDSIASDIVKNNSNSRLKIGNLYFAKYAYNYKANESIVVVNTLEIRNRLRTFLLETLGIFIVIEVLLYFATKRITKWITKPAEESFNKQKEFIADASHELKTPLAVIMASADELKPNKYVENIKNESERMSNLLASMLDLSKLESGVTKNTYKEENLSKIVSKMALTLEAVAYEKDIKLNTNIEDKIMFNCNKEEMERVVSILIDNAIKHSYDKSTIKVNLKTEKNNIILEVINSGDPIAEGDEEKIFDRFYRGDKSRNRGDNRYGLGLAIAKNIVINHKGTIKASSSNGKTTFKINFSQK